MRDAQRYDLDPNPRSRSQDPKVAKSPKFKVYLFCQNSLNLKTEGRLLHYRTLSGHIFEIRPSSLSRDFELGTKNDREL